MYTCQICLFWFFLLCVYTLISKVRIKHLEKPPRCTSRIHLKNTGLAPLTHTIDMEAVETIIYRTSFCHHILLLDMVILMNLNTATSVHPDFKCFSCLNINNVSRPSWSSSGIQGVNLRFYAIVSSGLKFVFKFFVMVLIHAYI